ncbi:MAG TPA: DMT family transporter [Beijerinckiaceae bacterium]|nr:DMT family transporter [Beijerinckiaceae bacterium]
MSSRVAVLAMLGAVLIYGANFALSRHAVLHGLTPNDLTAFRFGLGGLLLLPAFVRRGATTCAGIGWRRGAVLAFISGVPMVLLMTTGLKLAPAAHGAAIQPGTVTVVGAIAAAVAVGAFPARPVVIGIAVVIAGLACLALAGSTGGTNLTLLGDLCFVAGGALWGLYPFFLNRWRIDGLTSTSVVAVLSLVFVPFWLLAGTRILDLDPAVVLFHAVNQGVFNLIVALWLWGAAVRVLGPERAARFPPLIPVAGTILAIPIVGEWPGPLQSLGVALIVGGLALAAFGPRLFGRPTLGRRL